MRGLTARFARWLALAGACLALAAPGSPARVTPLRNRPTACAILSAEAKTAVQ